jgi:hypothetical protein
MSVEEEFLDCCRKGRGDEIKKYISDYPELLRIYDDMPFRLVASMGYLSLVKYFLHVSNYSINPESLEFYAILGAALNGHYDVYQYLLGICKNFDPAEHMKDFDFLLNISTPTDRPLTNEEKKSKPNEYYTSPKTSIFIFSNTLKNKKVNKVVKDNLLIASI